MREYQTPREREPESQKVRERERENYVSKPLVRELPTKPPNMIAIDALFTADCPLTAGM